LSEVKYKTIPKCFYNVHILYALLYIYKMGINDIVSQWVMSGFFSNQNNGQCSQKGPKKYHKKNKCNNNNNDKMSIHIIYIY